MNTTAKPTIPDNNFTIEGLAPIIVTTNANGVTISADSVGGIGDTIQAEYFIAGTDSADGGMIFRLEDGTVPIKMRSDCGDEALIDVDPWEVCPTMPALIMAKIDGTSAFVADIYPQATIKGLTNIEGVNGIIGASSASSGVTYGIRGAIESNDPDAAAVFGLSSADWSAGVKGVAGGINGYGIVSHGRFEVKDQTGANSLFFADPTYHNVKVFKSDGSLLTEFGGTNNRAPIQTVNTTAKPTIPDNNFTIEGLAPIIVTTNANGVTISADSVGGIGDTIQAEYFIAGDDSAHGGMIFNRAGLTYSQKVIKINSECDSFPMIHASSFGTCTTSSSVMSIKYGGPLSEIDTFPQAAIKGIWDFTGDGIGITAISKGGNAINAYSISGNSNKAAIYAYQTTGAYRTGYGVKAITTAEGYGTAGVYGEATSPTGHIYGLYGKTQSNSANSAGVYGWADDSASAIHGYNPDDKGAAGLFEGILKVMRSDHPIMIVDDNERSLSLYEYEDTNYRVVLDAYDGCMIRNPDPLAPDVESAFHIRRANKGTGLTIDSCYTALAIHASDNIALDISGAVYADSFHTVRFTGYDGSGVHFDNTDVKINQGDLYVHSSLTIDGDATCPEITCVDLIVGTIDGHNVDGNLTVNGNFTVSGGVKSFLEPHPLDPNKSIRFVCTEANQALIEHRNQIALSGGYAEFEIPEEFILVAEPGTFSVIVTAQTLDDPGRLGAIVEDGIVKIRAHGASSDYRVAYTITAIRKGYADYEAVIDNE